ncbi:hypothetical protein EON62_02920, partial [archaeon]
MQEMDGVRIFTAETHQFLEPVATSLKNISEFGDLTPAAMLTDAAENFARGDASCDETIRHLKRSNSLHNAVTECRDAALAEWDVTKQKALLRAATFGKGFDELHEASEFVSACKMLRVLNVVRAPEVALPLTAAQYEALTPTGVVGRLAARHQHNVALQICNYLGLRKDAVLMQWASYVAKGSDLPDQEVCTLIGELLRGLSNVSYANIASAADSAGRRTRATMLLDLEPHATDKVPILLAMKRSKLALKKALDSGDMDLVH